MSSRHASRLVVSLLAGLLLPCVLPACSLETAGSGQPESTDDGDDDAEPGDGDDPEPDDSGSVTSQDAGVIGVRDAAVTPPATTSGDCTGGRYEGTYECTYKQAGPFGGLSSSVVSGAVSFVLSPKGGKDDIEFDLAAGKFAPGQAALQTITATIDGKLECGEPFEGKLVKGMAAGLLQPTSSFEGEFFAVYDTKLTTFVQGTMSIPANSDNDGCTGSWTAKLVTVAVTP